MNSLKSNYTAEDPKDVNTEIENFTGAQRPALYSL